MAVCLFTPFMHALIPRHLWNWISLFVGSFLGFDEVDNGRGQDDDIGDEFEKCLYVMVESMDRLQLNVTPQSIVVIKDVVQVRDALYTNMYCLYIKKNNINMSLTVHLCVWKSSVFLLCFYIAYVN